MSVISLPPYPVFLSGFEKTFRHPMTYVGAFAVGSLSLYTSDFSWGAATPFLVPFAVQAFTRVLSEHDYLQDIRPQLQPVDGERLPSLLNMAAVVEVLEDMIKRGNPRTLIKIRVNEATEVVRLTDPEHLSAEADLLSHMEGLIRERFADGRVYQTAFNSYLVVLDCACLDITETLFRFIDAHSAAPVEIGGRTYYPKLYAGVTELEDNLGVSLSRLDYAIRKAAVSADRAAVYVAKDDPEFAHYQENRMGLRVLRQALNESELGLFAQPIVPMDAASGERKFEILLRHYEDTGKITPPGELLGYAGFNDITQDVDLYVIDLLGRNFHRVFGEGGRDVDTVTVNISGPSFVRPQFAEAVIQTLAKYRVPAEKIILEVTEDVANGAKVHAIRTMETLRAAGFKLALDDIGTGSSNFRTLHEFPVDYFKIDRSYSEDMTHDRAIRAFVQLIIDIGRANGKQIIAEGIPDTETQALLKRMGADYSQSYITGRPAELIAAPRSTASRDTEAAAA